MTWYRSDILNYETYIAYILDMAKTICPALPIWNLDINKDIFAYPKVQTNIQQ